MIPQIIYLAFILLVLMSSSYSYGKADISKKDYIINIILVILTIALLWWGGFFKPLFN